MKLFLALACGLVAFGQTTTTAVSPETANQPVARIHVYRPKAKMVGIALHPSIYFDGMELYRLGAGTFFTATVPAGKHLITAGRSEVGQLLDIEAGKEYYFLLGHKNMFVTGLGGAEPMTLSLVTEDEARSGMRGLKELKK